MHNANRIGSNDSFTQARPKSGDGSPVWYAPHRDALHNYGKWMHEALTRFDGQEIDPVTMEAIKKSVQPFAQLVNAIHEGKFAGKEAELKTRLEELMKNDVGYSLLGAAFMTTMIWKFWYFAGEVSLRQEGPIKL